MVNLQTKPSWIQDGFVCKFNLLYLGQFVSDAVIDTKGTCDIVITKGTEGN